MGHCNQRNSVDCIDKWDWEIATHEINHFRNFNFLHEFETLPVKYQIEFLGKILKNFEIKSVKMEKKEHDLPILH